MLQGGPLNSLSLYNESNKATFVASLDEVRREAARRSLREGTSAVGFKMMHNQGMNRRVFASVWLKQRNVSVLYLQRANVLRAVISDHLNQVDRARSDNAVVGFAKHIAHAKNEEVCTIGFHFFIKKLIFGLA